MLLMATVAQAWAGRLGARPEVIYED